MYILYLYIRRVYYIEKISRDRYIVDMSIYCKERFCIYLRKTLLCLRDYEQNYKAKKKPTKSREKENAADSQMLATRSKPGLILCQYQVFRHA
jgi:hypothetical protein